MDEVMAVMEMARLLKDNDFQTLGGGHGAHRAHAPHAGIACADGKVD